MTLQESVGPAGDGRAPLVSFLTTAYRTEEYLPAMIDSVRAQSSPDWELIVVDNGNSAGVVEVVDRYRSDGRIRLVRQENRGYCGGVMAAAQLATGRFLSVLDSDDRVLPEFVATLGQFVDAHPEVHAVGCDAVHYDQEEQTHRPTGHLDSLGVRWEPRFAQQRLALDTVLAGVIPYYTGLVRRDAWDAVGGYRPSPDLDDAELPHFADHVVDVVMWLRLVREFDVRLVDARLGWCRIRGGSLSRDVERVEAFERAFIETLSATAGGSGSAASRTAAETMIRKLRFHQELRRARGALLAGDVPSARRHARQAYALRQGLRAGVRAAAVVTLLAVFPRALRRIHPYKQRVAASRRRARQHASA